MTRGVSHTPQTLAQHDDDDQHDHPDEEGDDQNRDRYDGDDDSNNEQNVSDGDGDDTISSPSWEPPPHTHMNKRCDTFCSKDQDFHLGFISPVTHRLYLKSHNAISSCV